MIKKTIYLLLLLISFGLQAQNAVGDWNIYGVFGNNVINVIDANSKVYSLVGYIVTTRKIKKLIAFPNRAI